MSTDNDFVARLRIRWDAMGDMANDERAAAATEIESLRSSQREMMRTIATLRAERDEARREWCIQSIEAQTGNRAPVEMLAKKLAEDIRGWDCYKEVKP